MPNDSHITHDRLMALEESVREINSRTGKMESTVDHIAEKVDTFLDAVAKHTDSVEKRISPLEEKEKARAKRWSIVKKVAVPALIASAGVIGSQFGEVVLHALKELVK